MEPRIPPFETANPRLQREPIGQEYAGFFKDGFLYSFPVFRAKTAQNVLILVGLQWFNRLIGLVTKVFLVRLLFPDDFGIFALATGLIGFVGTFGNFGLDYAIIQKGDRATAEDYDVAMSMRILISLVLFISSIAIAGPWGSLFGEPLLSPATQVLAIAYLVIPWSFVPSTRLTTELRYKAIAIPNLTGQLMNAFASVSLAFIGFGIWSLVYGLMLGQVVSTIAFSVLHPWKFRFSLRKHEATPLLRYATPIMITSVILFLIANVDDFTVGFFLGSTALGFYAVAVGFGTLPTTFLSGPAGSALFPTLVKIQERIESLRGGYLDGFSYTAAIVAPACIGMAVIAPEIVNILLGPIWAPATLPLLVLAFYGLARALIDFSSSLFSAVGRPRVIAELNLYVLIGSLVPLLPLTFAFGIAGTAVSMTIPMIIVAGLSIVKSAQVLKGTTRQFLSRLWGPIIAAETMGVLVFGLRIWLYTLLPDRIVFPFFGLSVHAATVVLLFGLLFGVFVYFALLRVLDGRTFEGLRHHLLLGLGLRGEGLRQVK